MYRNHDKIAPSSTDQCTARMTAGTLKTLSHQWRAEGLGTLKGWLCWLRVWATPYPECFDVPLSICATADAYLGSVSPGVPVKSSGGLRPHVLGLPGR